MPYDILQILDAFDAKGETAGDELEGEHPNGPKIHCLIVLLSRDEFWR